MSIDDFIAKLSAPRAVWLMIPDAVVDSTHTEWASETIQTVLTHAPGNGAPIGEWKVVAEKGWFAARPAGMEDIYKIYAESFGGADHLHRILEEAQTIVNEALTTGTSPAHTSF